MTLNSAPATADEIRRAIHTFVHGYCYLRSFSHPYLPERAGELWVMRDAPRRSGTYRNEEWVAQGLSAASEIVRIVNERQRGAYTISVICGMDEPQGDLRKDFKALGYRFRSSEALMVHRLEQIPEVEAPADIQRVQTEADALRLGLAMRARPLTAEELAPASPLRQYMAQVDGDVVGWVRSVAVEDAAYCADMYVRPAHRRRGIALAMLCQMLADDRDAGARRSALLAGTAGARLYPRAGYEQIGVLLLFSPKK